MTHPDWTVTTLKEFIDAEFKHINSTLAQYQAAHQTIHATEAEYQRKTSDTVDKKLDEISEVLERVQGTLSRVLPRESYEVKHKDLETRIERLEHWRFTVAGRTAVLVALIGVAAGLLGVFVGHILGV